MSTIPRTHVTIALAALRSSIGLALLLSCAIGFAQDPQALRESLRGSERDIADRMRDEARKPVAVLNFLGLQQGMTVLDVYAAGGYYTFILSRAVGSDGTVYAQNSPRALRYDEDRTDMTQGDALAGKIERGKLDNVIRIDRAINDNGLPDSSIDFILVSQILHDYYNSSPARAHGLLLELHRLLKPGGIVGIIDHSGAEGNDNRRLHRMLKSQAVAAATRAGFLIEADSDLLANASDNPRRSIFDPLLNRGTDQFLLRLRKPGAE